CRSPPSACIRGAPGRAPTHPQAPPLPCGDTAWVPSATRAALYASARAQPDRAVRETRHAPISGAASALSPRKRKRRLWSSVLWGLALAVASVIASAHLALAVWAIPRVWPSLARTPARRATDESPSW